MCLAIGNRMLMSIHRSLKQLDSVCDKLSTDRAVVDLLSTVPAELVSAEQCSVFTVYQTDSTIRATSSTWTPHRLGLCNCME